MSKLEFSADLNALAPGEIQAPSFHQLYRQTLAACTTIVEGIEMANFLAPYHTIQSLYASRGEAVPAAMLPRAEILAEPAYENEDGEEIAAILHVPAWSGGFPVPRILSTFGSVYPGLNIANITIAQNGEVERRRQTERTIQNRSELIKNSLLAKLPHDIIDTMNQAEFQPGQTHLSQMDIRQTMSWAMDRFGDVPSEDVAKATRLVYKFFRVSDLVNADALDIAITKRQAILATLKPDARPTFFLIRPDLDKAGRGHPAFEDLVKFHYTTTAVEDMSFTTLRAAIRAKYNNLVALHNAAIAIWASKQHDGSAALTNPAVTNANRKAGGGASNSGGGGTGGSNSGGGGTNGANECQNHLLGRICGLHYTCRTTYPHDAKRLGICKTFGPASDKAKLFDSMPAEQQKSVRAAKEAKDNFKKGNHNRQQQPRDFSKGGTIASAPASFNRRHNGRASANAASADDDVISSDED